MERSKRRKEEARNAEGEECLWQTTHRTDNDNEEDARRQGEHTPGLANLSDKDEDGGLGSTGAGQSLCRK